jgi:hypothetical protein
VRPPTFRFFLRRIVVSTANFSSFFMSSQGKNAVAMEKIKTIVVTTTNEALFNPTIKLNLLQIHHHHPTQQNIVQLSPHNSMKMAAVHASMARMGGNVKESITSMLLSPAGLTRHGMPGRFWCCCAIIGLDGPDLATLLSASTRPADGCSRPAS